MSVGVRSVLVYGWESTFKTEATTKDKVFGRGQELTTLTLNNNPELLYTLGSRFGESIVARQLTGSWGIRARLSNPWFLQGFFNSVSTVDNGNGSYTHTFSFSGNSNPKSLTIAVGVPAPDENIARILLGGVITDISISCSVNELVELSLSGIYADESLSTTLPSAVSETEDAFTFAQGTIELPSGTTIAEVQSISLTLRNNALMIYGLGSRKPNSFVDRNIEVTGDLSLRLRSSTYLKYLYGNSSATSPQNSVDEIANMKLTFTNGKTGADKREIVVEITGVMLNSLSMPIRPEDLVRISIPFTGRQVQIKATNSTSSPK